MKAFSKLENQKIFNYFSHLVTPEKLIKINENILHKTEYILPVFQDIYQYRNAAAIVRSLEGLGINKLVALEGRNEFLPNEDVSRGAEKWIIVEKMKDELSSLSYLKNNGYLTAVVSPENEAINIADLPINRPIALIFGTEWNGISSSFLEECDVCVKIPMYGFTQSFNVSVAASICAYELTQRLRKSNINILLDEEKVWETKRHWIVNSVANGSEILQHFLSKNFFV